MHTYTYVCVYMCVYIYIERERERERERYTHTELAAQEAWTTVSFRNFTSRNFKLSVSNPKRKYLAYLSVLSRISNCQGLGRKNTFEILKTDRIELIGGSFEG